MMSLLIALVIGAAPHAAGCAGPGPGAPSCGRQTVAHGLVTPVVGATACTVNSECNSAPKPACAAPSDNMCACTARDSAGVCTTGRCVWHPDPGNLSCVCVPGQVESCTLPAGGAGTQACNATGTAFNPCA
jgi:hypothetical protein